MPGELEHAVRLSPGTFQGRKYEDTGLAQATEGDSYANNDYVSRNFFAQIKHRTEKTPTPDVPTRVSLRGLSLKEDANSDYGLVFAIGDEAEIILSQELSYHNNGRRFSRTDERGVPIWDENGTRAFYARDNGLSGVCLSWGLVLLSRYEDLAFSGSGGRVVVRTGEDSSQKTLEEQVTNLRKQSEAQIAEFANRARKAENYLRTGKLE